MPIELTAKEYGHYCSSECPDSMATANRYKGEKGKAWKAVKEWVRRTYQDCYTCNARDLISYNAQAGHYAPVGLVGSNNHLSWDSDFIRLQCGRCNGPGQGMAVEFRARLVQEHGEEKVAEFDRQVKARTINPVKDWKAIKEHFDSL